MDAGRAVWSVCTRAFHSASYAARAASHSGVPASGARTMSAAWPHRSADGRTRSAREDGRAAYSPALRKIPPASRWRRACRYSAGARPSPIALAAFAPARSLAAIAALNFARQLHQILVEAVLSADSSRSAANPNAALGWPRAARRRLPSTVTAASSASSLLLTMAFRFSSLTVVGSANSPSPATSLASEFMHSLDYRFCRIGKSDLAQPGVQRRDHVAILAGFVLHDADVAGVSALRPCRRMRPCTQRVSNSFLVLRECDFGVDGCARSRSTPTGASVPPQPATLTASAIPSTQIQVLQKARRIDGG